MHQKHQFATLQTHHGIYTVFSYRLTNDGFNSLYTIIATTLLPNESFCRVLSAGKAFFKPQESLPHYMPVDIKNVTVNKVDTDSYCYEITLVTPLYRLGLKLNNYVYARNNLTAIFQTLLSKYDIFNVSFKFKDKNISFLLQHQTSDLDLFYSLVHQHGLIFFLDKKLGIFIITDDISQHRQQENIRLYQVSTNHQNYLQLHLFQQMLVETLTIKATNPNDLHQMYSATSFNQTGLSGIGEATFFSPYPTCSQQQLVETIECLQKQIDCLRLLFLIQTNHNSFNVGDVITIDNQKTLLKLRIISIEHNTDTGAHQRHHASTRLILVPSTRPFLQLDCFFFNEDFLESLHAKLSCFTQENRQIPHALIAPRAKRKPLLYLKATIADTAFTPPSDDTNQYRLKFFDHDGDFSALTPSLAVFYGQPGQGSYLPYYANTTVMVGFINDSPFFPIILGAIVDKSTEALKARYLIRSYKNLVMAFDEKEYAVVFGKENSTMFCLNVAEQLSTLKIPAENGCLTLYAKNTFNLKAHSGYFNAKEMMIQTRKFFSIHCNIVQVHSNQLQITSKLQTFLQAKQLMINANIMVNSQCLSLQAQESLTLRANAISGHGNTTYNAQESLTICCNGYQLIFNKNGSISTTAPIKIVAPLHNISPQTRWLNPS